MDFFPSLFEFISKGQALFAIEKGILPNGMCTVNACSHIIIQMSIHLFISDPQLIKNLTAKNANIYRFIYTGLKCESR